jgi:predicted ATPase
MGATRIRCLKIEKFRRFNNITIPFGNNVTLIAGQNGTSKSTLLGMLAQPFSFGVVRGKTAGQADESSYTANYHGLKLQEDVDLTGKPFMYDCDDVFRLSKQFDLPKRYVYSTELDGADIVPGSRLQEHPLTTMSRVSSERMRFWPAPAKMCQCGLEGIR